MGLSIIYVSIERSSELRKFSKELNVFVDTPLKNLSKQRAEKFKTNFFAERKKFVKTQRQQFQNPLFI